MPNPKRNPAVDSGGAPDTSSNRRERCHEGTPSPDPVGGPFHPTDAVVRFARRAGCVCPNPLDVWLRPDLSTGMAVRHNHPACPLAGDTDGGAA